MIMTTVCVYDNKVTKSKKRIKKDPDLKSVGKHSNRTLLDPSCVMTVPKATHTEWLDFLHKQSGRFGDEQKKFHEFEELKNDRKGDNIVKLLKALTDPEVISLIHNKLKK